MTECVDDPIDVVDFLSLLPTSFVFLFSSIFHEINVPSGTA